MFFESLCVNEFNKKAMRFILQLLIVPAIIVCPMIGNELQFVQENEQNSSSFNQTMFTAYRLNDRKERKENSTYNNLAAIDANADIYASAKHAYSLREAVELRKNLYKQIENNPTSLPLYWAMMRFYAVAPNFVGGNAALALQFAGYISSQDQYIGCMAYEYVYTRIKDFTSAEYWYRKSLMVLPPKDMYWEEITYRNAVQFGVKITGNFNNWKLQNMYENSAGIYSRKVMIPKCENCVYKLIIDYKNIATPSKTEILPNDR